MLLALAVFVLALLPRVAVPGDFWTTDEARHWSGRSERFLAAVQAGDFAATNQTGHPGVTTMWLGAAGAWLYQQEVARGAAVPIEQATRFVEQGDYGQAAVAYATAPADFAHYRYLLRLPVGIVTALVLLLCYLLLRRLFGEGTALLAALLLLADPFLVAHSNVLHLDALLTVCMLLSLLAALAAFEAQSTTRKTTAMGDGHAATEHPSLPLLLLSAVAGGLAFLTKSPSVLLPPLVALVGLVVVVRSAPPRIAAWRSLVAALAVWGVVALLICLALWPALWVDPVGSIQTIINEAAGNGGQAHPDGSFFLGQAVGDPGWLFYPAALVLRLTPWALLGVLALAWPTRERQHRVLVALLVVAVLAFLLLLSIPPKKFDRYILPVFPLLDILAAVGIVRLWSAGMRWWGRGVSMLVPGAVYGLVLAALAFNMLWYHPYQLAYFNPLLGGGPVAARTITVGWGEGLEQAGAYITAQPDGCAYPLAAWYEETILPYVCTAVMNLGWANDPATVNYAVLYINQVQRGIYADITAMLPERAALVQQVTIHGVPYAWVYQLPRPLPMQAKAQFGDVLRLHSYGIDITNIRTDGVLQVTTQWQARTLDSTDYMLFLHLLDAEGTRIAQADVPPAGPHVPTSQWQPRHFQTWAHPLPVGADLPPGRYWLALGLYNPADFARLSLAGAGAAQPDAPDYGAGALLLPVAIE
ncbi:MAG: phospholipid carrier-dependent glycosyltransferase [Chloroflexaceae bacterium]|nr:phospholipid carrier-dependent glycosyltransferase [Chloroflexaceae bacterium]